MDSSRRTVLLWWPLITLGCGGFAPRDYGGEPRRSNAGMAGFSYDAGTGDAGRATSSPPHNETNSDWGPAASGGAAQASLDSNDVPHGHAAAPSSDADDGAGQGGNASASGDDAGATSHTEGGVGGSAAQAAGAAGSVGKNGGGAISGGKGGTSGRGGASGNGGVSGTTARGGSGGRAGGGGGGEHDAGADGGGGLVERALLFSEYVEGSHEKALELRALAASSLDGCEVVISSNGGSSITRLALEGELAENHTYVFCSTELVEQLATVCDRTFGRTFNGNDAVTLECDGLVLDAIGQVGVDPKTAWSGSGVSTADQVLRRRCSVTHGDTVATDPFDPSLEWQSHPLDELSGLGAPDCD